MQKVPNIRSRDAGIASTDITNELALAVNGLAPVELIGQYDSGPRREPGVYLIRNDSGGNLSQYDIVGLQGPLVEASDDLDSFRCEIAFKGVIPVAPTHYGKWGVLQCDIKSGAYGLVRVAGIAVARVTINDPTDLCAGITSGDPSRLNSSPSAVSQILATSTVAGVTWAYVRLGTTVEAEDLNCST